MGDFDLNDLRAIERDRDLPPDELYGPRDDKDEREPDEPDDDHDVT